jgi:Arc/MetJ family transcription regulator
MVKRSAAFAPSDPGGVPIRPCQVYAASVIKRTNINLDLDLVEQAAHELGTRRTTDTVHEALRDVVARARRVRLARRDFADLTPDALEQMRRPTGRSA